MTDSPPDKPGPLANRSLAVTTRLVVAVALVAVTVGAVAWLYGSRPMIQEADPEASRRDVVVMRVAPVDVQRQWRGYGAAQAVDSADVPARVTATVAEVPRGVVAGARVVAGQLLVKLDEADFARQLEIAQRRIDEIDAMLAQIDVEDQALTRRLILEESDVAMARREYERHLSLRERNVNNPQDVDAAQRTLITAERSQLAAREAFDSLGPRRRSLQAQRASQQAQVNLAQLNLERTRVASPIDGVLQSVDVEVGESVAAGQRVARVVAMDRIEVPLSLPGAAQGSVRVGDRVELRPTSRLPNLLGWETTVSRISPETDASTRTLTAFCELSADAGNGGLGLLPVPGMFLEGVVHVKDVEPRVLVPRQAIRGGRVQVVTDGTLVSREVTVLFTLTGPRPSFGLNVDQWAVLDDGALRKGDLLLANAATQVADGAPVAPVWPDGTRVRLAGEADGGDAPAGPPGGTAP